MYSDESFHGPNGELTYISPKVRQDGVLGGVCGCMVANPHNHALMFCGGQQQ